jgi:hypothetical protein
MGLQREAGKRRKPAAEADLQKQHRPWIESSAFTRKSYDQADEERAEHIDSQRNERKPARMPYGQ